MRALGLGLAVTLPPGKALVGTHWPYVLVVTLGAGAHFCTTGRDQLGRKGSTREDRARLFRRHLRGIYFL